jgi:type I restriction enzyme S subunit
VTFLAIAELRRNAPACWGWLPLRRVAMLRNERNNASIEPLLALSSERGTERRPDDGGRQLPSEETIRDYWVVRPGDLVFNPMWAIGGGVAVSCIEGAVSPAYRVYRLGLRLVPRYLHYFLRSATVIDQYSLMTRGLTTFDRSVSREDLEAMPVPLPPLDEQQAIADYLDAETARIDSLIKCKARLLQLEEERRSSFVATLLSFQGDATCMWMGAISTVWPVVALGLLAQVFNGTTPEGIDRDAGDVAWVTSGDIDQGVVSSPSGYISESIRRAHGMRIAPQGSVVVGLIGQGRTRGSSALLGIAAVLNQNIAAIVPRDGRLDSEYLRLLLLLAYEDLRNGGRGANQAALNCEILKSYQVPLAPPDQQLEMVRTVAIAHAREEAVASALRRQIDLLVERRQALITAAVTGQIEIPGVAA